MKQLDATPKWNKYDSLGKPVGVDEKNNMILGYIVAKKGEFKSKGRGKFNEESLSKIVQLYPPAGIKSRFTHPTLSSDGLGKYLGRSLNPRIDGDVVRADLRLDESSFNTPHGNLGGYVMSLAKNDPEAFSSSLVLQAEQIFDRDDKGRIILGEDGEPLAPLWLPTSLKASDVVDTGDAVDEFMSADGLSLDELPDAMVRRGSELLNQAFPGQPREVVEARLNSWLSKYLDLRYGPAKGRNTGSLKIKRRAIERTFKS